MSQASGGITAEKLKAAVTLGLSLEQAVQTGVIPLPPQKLQALQTLGLTLEQAVQKGLIKPTEPVDEAKATTAPDAGEKRKREEDEPASKAVPDQEQERRKAAAARYAKKGEAPEKDLASSPAASQSKSKAGEADVAAIGGINDESLVDVVSAVVKFRDPVTGVARAPLPQASEVAYLISHSVFWTLFRRLAAEILALEEGAKDIDNFWERAPNGSESALQFAKERGYFIPAGVEDSSAEASWRRAVLAEAAADLMAIRIVKARGFDLHAMAGPANNGTEWAERPDGELEGIASIVDSSASIGLAEDLIQDLNKAVNQGSSVFAGDSSTQERLSAIAQAVESQGPPAIVDSAGHAPALKGGWTLLQEMRVREVAAELRQEFTVRREILLRRLDVTVQVMCSCEHIAAAAVQRKSADVLSRMWAGWRRSATRAPPLSEWSALAVTRAVLARAVDARVSGPGARVSSRLKKVKIGSVPNRGGKPEGYQAQTNQRRSAAGTATQAEGGAASAVRETTPQPKAHRGPRHRTFAASATTSSGSGAAASSSTGANADGGHVLGGHPLVDGAASSSAVANRDAVMDEASVSVAAKPEEKKAPSGARSTNKDLHKEYRIQKRKEWEGTAAASNYYEELKKNRPGAHF